MAKDIRDKNSNPRLNEQRRKAIVAECRRQEESCLYTSTSLYIWLRCVRLQKQLFVAIPIILGGIAGVSLFQSVLPDWLIATLAFIAGLIPILVDGLKIETRVDELIRLAATFKALQDRFRRVATITVLSDLEKAEETLAELMDQMDIGRSSSITAPERYFLQAREKINAGHYNFLVDEQQTKNA